MEAQDSSTITRQGFQSSNSPITPSWRSSVLYWTTIWSIDTSVPLCLNNGLNPNRFMIKIWQKNYSKLHLYWSSSKSVSLIKENHLKLYIQPETSHLIHFSSNLYIPAHVWLNNTELWGKATFNEDVSRSMIAKNIKWFKLHQGLFVFVSLHLFFPFCFRFADSWVWQSFFLKCLQTF